MNINKELEKKLNNFPEELQILAEDILMDISKKSKVSIEEMILDELNHIIQEEE